MASIAKIVAQFDDLTIFNPSKWPFRELLSKILAILIVIYLIYTKIDTFSLFPGTIESLKHFFSGINNTFSEHHFSVFEIQFIWCLRFCLWFLETGILVVYVIAYLTRMKAIHVAKGFMEVVFPFIVAVIPIIISLTPYNFSKNIPYDSKFYILLYSGIAFLMIIGGIINLIGLFTLRKSFTIMSEARTLVTRGIYRFIRHPLYLGHFIMFFGSLCLRLHSYTIIMYLGFLGGQILRARIEERKLSAAFPVYDTYRKTTPMIFPFNIRLLIKK